MKKRVLSLIAAVCLSMALTACGKEQQKDNMEAELLPGDERPDETVDDTKNVGNEEGEVTGKTDIQEEITPAEQAKSFSFEELSTRQFYFSSGVGAWSEEFTIEKDGYFTGKFHDSNMGETGEEYPNGTRYSCAYSGHFEDITRVGEYIYEMKLADISYKEESGTEEILDGMKYIYTDAYFMGADDMFYVYLPGMPIEEMSESLYMWVRDYNQSESELTMIVIADEKNELAAASLNRLAPLEDAQMNYNFYKESFDYYAGKLANEAQTTLEMVEYSGKMYELSDECLNYIWNLIRYNVSEDRFAEILKEQRAWIKEKEEKAKEAADAYAGGSFASVSANDMLAQLTIERCAVLLEYLN
ncbi:MAG: DUF1311 domain-containing protein [Lachnospiraceae bacterium]|nr:DUF1311 domain-containing protein [Lachnospiraceae bacterium]